jgi:hypothetical protein
MEREKGRRGEREGGRDMQNHTENKALENSREGGRIDVEGIAFREVEK